MELSRLHSPGRFGGKSMVTDLVWPKFHGIVNYIEPFAGSLAMLLAGPTDITRTVNDKDGYVANFWRSISYDPEMVAHYADWPVNENDLHARHAWLIQRKEDLVRKLEGDPDYHDPKIAGWWVWGQCIWIGHGWCSGKGPWQVVGGELVRTGDGHQKRQRPHLNDRGVGINRRLPHIGRGQGIIRGLPHLGNRGQGINRKLPHLGDRGEWIADWFLELHEIIRDVRVCSGDWSRVVGTSPTTKIGLTGVFLDPPYSSAKRDTNLYSEDSMSVAQDVGDWCRKNESNPLLRIALCGYDGEHDLPGWTEIPWKASGSYGQSNGNETLERIWFSPGIKHDDRQCGLFD